MRGFPHFFWILALTASAVASPSSVEEIVRTGFNASQLKKHLQDIACHQDEEHFRACIEAVQKLLLSSEPPARLIPLPAGSDPSPDIPGRFGPTQAIPLPRVPYPVAANLEAEVAAARAREPRENSLWREAFRSGSAHPVPFSRIIDWAQKRFRSPEKEALAAYYAFRSYSEYLHFGPSGIVPAGSSSSILPGTLTMPETQLGIVFDRAAELALILDVAPGSVAEDAGLRPKDVIVRIDRKTVIGMTSREIVDSLSQPEGKTVLLEVARGDRLLKLALKPEERVHPLVASRMLDAPFPTGYLRLGTFGNYRACEAVTEAVRKLTRAGARGLILDLRGNQGGLVSEALCILGLFLGDNQLILIQMDPTGREPDAKNYSGPQALTDLPLAVLVNDATASASEIVSGVLQDRGRAWIVGERTWGKGTIFIEESLPEERAFNRKKITAVFHYPSGRTPQGGGVAPDFEAYSTAVATARDRLGIYSTDSVLRLARAEASPSETLPPEPRSPEELLRVGTCARQSKSVSGAPDHPLDVAVRVLECIH